MPRAATVHVARKLEPGRTRASSPGAVLSCLLLAPPPDWVAVDMATGTLLRSGLSDEGSLSALAGDPLQPFSLVLAEPHEPWDPSRPDSVEVAAASERRAPSRRVVRKLLEAVVCRQDGGGLLGSVGPSISYLDIDGGRPSVNLLDPGRKGVRIFSDGEGGVSARFRFGERTYLLPVVPGAAQWLTDGRVPVTTTLSRGARRSAHRPAVTGVEPTGPVYLVVGFARPLGGQVRKVVLGLVPSR